MEYKNRNRYTITTCTNGSTLWISFLPVIQITWYGFVFVKNMRCDLTVSDNHLIAAFNPINYHINKEKYMQQSSAYIQVW